ncbi:site-specific DNA-methyltransferase [Haloarcula sp. H-GB4]|jgi:DNA modification methylase|uniref:DNA-methyltransferase n=1 Tax=Haloarcula sp. H-GB4 TaxID=3069755 RepID=UPI0027B7D9DA|nr:site-specific DNA-methyltransferase [Haloarcula sp. H-GB4]MDQ2074836.1 site-specific DNA-methyltransferase [Haloarcula sp. H-GB4]
MADEEYSLPSSFQDFYLFDESVEEFAGTLTEHLDPLVLNENLFVQYTGSIIDQFQQDSDVSSDGGALAKQNQDVLRLETYLMENAALAHALYDELAKHYELREVDYWSATGMAEILGKYLDQESVGFPYEVSYREHLSSIVLPEFDLDDDPKPIDLAIRDRLLNDEGKLETIDTTLQAFFREHEIGPPPTETMRRFQGSDMWDPEDRTAEVYEADARYIVPEGSDSPNHERADPIPLDESSIDLILTSPPYWKKRKYFTDEGEKIELGQETAVEDYVSNLVDALERWKVFLRPTGSVFFNIGDTFKNKSLQGVPGLFAQESQKRGWTIRNEITWTKPNGVPSPVDDRLTSRHERIFHLVQNDDYFYDREGYIDIYDTGSNPTDVWEIAHDRNTGGHLAPFPRELVQRAIALGCPPAVCDKCNTPHRRQTNKDMRGLMNETSEAELVEHLIKYEYYKLSPRRDQAQRAIKKFFESDLNSTHLRAIQAVGISDAGKAMEFQDGAGNNDETIEEYAEAAKEVLGGYFREFTFPQRQTVGWSSCSCDCEPVPGRVFDPFAGSGTTLTVAKELGYDAFGADLDVSHWEDS